MSSHGRRLARESAAYLVVSIIERGVAFLVLPFLTRALPVAGYGAVATAMVITNVLAMVFAFGLNFGIVRLYYDDAGSQGPARWAALARLQIATAIVLGTVVFATGPAWAPALLPGGWTAVLGWAVVYAALTAIKTTTEGVLRAARRPGAFGAVVVVEVVIGVPLGVLLADRIGPHGYLAGLSVGAAIAAIGGVVLTWTPARWDRRALVAGLGLSAPFMLHWLGGWGLNLSDRLIIEHSLGSAAVARYQVAYLIGSVLVLALEAGQAAWAPHYFGSLTPDERSAMPRRLVLPATLLAAAATVTLVALAPALVRLASPESYGAAPYVVAFVATATVVRVAYFLSITALTDHRRTAQIAAATLVATALNVGANLALIPDHGIAVAGLTTLGAFIVQTELVAAASRRLGTERVLDARVRAVWVGTLAGTVLLSELPTSGAVGIALRSAIAATALGGGLIGLQWIRDRYRQLGSSPLDTRP